MTKKASGIISTQYIIEPLTQASLSSFHLLGDQSNEQNRFDEINNIISGNSDLISLKVNTSLFNPYKFFEINFNKFSTIYFRKIKPNEILRIANFTKNSFVIIHLYKEKLTSLNLNPFFIWYFLKKEIGRYTYVPLGKEGYEIAVLSKNENLDDCFQYFNRRVYQTSQGGNAFSTDFSMENFINKEGMLTFHIKDKINYQILFETPGITEIIYCDINKAIKYYGIEIAREMTQERLTKIVEENKFMHVILDFLTYEGKLSRNEFDSILRSFGSNETKKNLIKYTLSFDGNSFEDDMETRMLLGKLI